MSKSQQLPKDNLENYLLDSDAIRNLDLNSEDFQEKLNKVLEENKKIEEAFQVDTSRLHIRIGK